MSTALYWFGTYLLIGFAFSFGTHLWVTFKKREAEQQGWKERLLNYLILLLIWPLVVAVLAHSVLFDRPRPERIYRAWIATPDSLIKQLSVDAIEQLEIYSDPLTAVPPLPFGHLHEAWLRFRHTLQPGDQLWSFRADTHDDEDLDWCRRYGVVEGYAVLRVGEIIGEFFAHMR